MPSSPRRSCRTWPGGSVLPAYVAEAVSVLSQALSLWPGGELAVAFNGGKDCTVLLGLLQLAAAKHKAGPAAAAATLSDQEVSAIFTKQVRMVYFVEEGCFPEQDEFIEQTERRYGFELLRLQPPPGGDGGGGLKQSTAQLVDEHGVRAFVMGTRRRCVCLCACHLGTSGQQAPAACVLLRAAACVLRACCCGSCTTGPWLAARRAGGWLPRPATSYAACPSPRPAARPSLSPSLSVCVCVCVCVCSVCLSVSNCLSGHAPPCAVACMGWLQRPLRRHALELLALQQRLGPIHARQPRARVGVRHHLAVPSRLRVRCTTSSVPRSRSRRRWRACQPGHT
jgi:hypothetical protein